MSSEGKTKEHLDSAFTRRERKGTDGAYLTRLADGETRAFSSLSVGRDAESAEHWPSRDEKLSKQHALVRVDLGRSTLRDLGSSNGTFHNGQRLPAGVEVVIEDGDFFRAGDNLFVFRMGIPPVNPPDELGLPGASPGIVAAREAVAAAALRDEPVTILGETGTGKELAARALHGQRKGAWVPVNCGELSKGLFRSELFGAERGAFTDAHEAKLGLVASAEAGTLFLDEIGDLALEVQVELLRFLEDGSFRALGATRMSRSSARVVAATHVDLNAAVERKTFRADLLARLQYGRAPIQLPALRERPEDIPGWFKRFATAAGHSEDLSPGALEALLCFYWPDNLRGLRRATLMALSAAHGRAVEAADLPKEVFAARTAARSLPTEDLAPTMRPPPAALTKETVEASLQEAQGVARRAAALLGVDRRKFYRLVGELGIDLLAFRRSASPDDTDR